jgi:hypothetical protein
MFRIDGTMPLVFVLTAALTTASLAFSRAAIAQETAAA